MGSGLSKKPISSPTWHKIVQSWITSHVSSLQNMFPTWDMKKSSLLLQGELCLQALIHVTADEHFFGTWFAAAAYLPEVGDVGVLLLHVVECSLPWCTPCQDTWVSRRSTYNCTPGEKYLQNLGFVRADVLVTDLKTPKMRPLLSVTLPSAPTCLSVIPSNLNVALMHT